MGRCGGKATILSLFFHILTLFVVGPVFVPGHILTSPMASSLPTLPFTVLKSLLDASPLTTDDGVLLRRMGLDIGVLHLVLACLSHLSHHAPRVPTQEFRQEVGNHIFYSLHILCKYL
jgi:hypothetical protein